MSPELSHVEVERSTRSSRWATVIFSLAIVALLSAPYWAGRGQMSLLVEFFYYLALAQLWNLLAGFAGVVSLGQHAFIGIGGYALFFMTIVWGWHPLVALGVAGVVGALLAVPIAALAWHDVCHGASTHGDGESFPLLDHAQYL